MYSYISVYAPDETDFSHNGLRILCPTACEITEILNGEYSLSITHPMDEWGSWQYIRENYIIKAQGQLFRIYRKTVTMSTDGGYEIQAEALHIFYDLNFYFIKDARPTLQVGRSALNWIVSHTYTDRGSSTAEEPTARFTFSSDIAPADGVGTSDDYRTAYYEKMSVTKALIGADNCFVTTWGGEILRDNFNVTINKRRGKDNAFAIKYGFDMTEISCEVDYSSYCSSVYYEATVFNETITDGTKERTESVFTGTASLNTLGVAVLPVPPMQAYTFDMNVKDVRCEGDFPTVYEMQAACEERAKEYMLLNCQPTINYRVSFADLKNFDVYKDFIGLQECNLGDIGKVIHELLGISTTQQIVRKTVDGITGETLSIELGSLRKSFTSDGRINGGMNSVQSELLREEIAAPNTWENLGNLGYTMADLNLSWAELEGNPITGGA